VPPIFDGVHWSTSLVCAQTLERAAAAGWRSRLIETIDDIDTADSLRRAGADAGPRTRAWILAHLT
jgi:glycosyltransferase A (GT-A) superfamily protein (DUF2064 family)